MGSKICEPLSLTLNLNVFILFADILKTLMWSYTSLCLKYLKVSLLFHFFCLFVFETRVLCSPGWGLHIAKGFERNQVFQKLSKSFIQCWRYSSFSRSGPACVGYISCTSTAESSSATVIWHSACSLSPGTWKTLWALVGKAHSQHTSRCFQRCELYSL